MAAEIACEGGGASTIKPVKDPVKAKVTLSDREKADQEARLKRLHSRASPASGETDLLHQLVGVMKDSMARQADRD